ncbi:helix-turn-helix domain-containing protein [Paraburkholderia bryophila]|uniref:XRE family transcriptional regulator n=1 Tax=Paraburkholderia bryophila TaxID=420952 RepID=UPI00234A4E37|nr:XRE family transcriptional regulator [Paraburkholderia bryophila]WCM23305.1 helix-turn-helix domain-containing protein [Paraburkholderia bryophila]
MTDIEHGSGNMYADLDTADAAAMHQKAELVSKHTRRIELRGCSTAQATRELGWPLLPDVLRGQFREVSITTIRRILERA